jgi:hypothetical protein
MIIDCISDFIRTRKKPKKSFREIRPKANCVVSFLQFIEKITPNENGCRIWPLGISHTGYGVFSINDFTYSVPRLLYNTLKDGYTGDGLVVRHKCDNRACCNIDHLEIGTQSDNLMDASKKKG